MALTTTSLCCRLRRDRRLVLSRCRDVGFGILAVLPDVTRNGAAALDFDHGLFTLFLDYVPTSTTSSSSGFGRTSMLVLSFVGHCQAFADVSTSYPYRWTLVLFRLIVELQSSTPTSTSCLCRRRVFVAAVVGHRRRLLYIIIRCLVLINIDSAVHCRLTVSRKVFSYRYVVKFPSFAMSLIVHTIVKDLARSRRRLFEARRVRNESCVNDNLDGLNTHDSTGLLRGGAGEGTIDAATSVSAFDYFTR
ncbi:hypothetical protein BDZ89DRAFT_1136833 [Hymenopellis radicata]|nr:hypothetical protein BDZ89DRAFT_1136833 [Hymenopellis radicata]